MILVIENFILDEEIKKLIDYYEENSLNAMHWHGTYSVDFSDYFIELKNKINSFVSRFSVKIDWGKIVKWPTDSYQPLHLDNASDKTVLSSIIYLNTGYQGGQTYFQDKTIITPINKRALFFDGTKYMHGVNKIEKGDRYTLAIWYKKC